MLNWGRFSNPTSRLSGGEKLYAVVGPAGTAVSVDRSPQAAVAKARSVGIERVIVDKVETRQELLANPKVAPTPEEAWRRMGHLRIDESALSMSLEEAHERLVRFFPTKRVYKKKPKKMKSEYLG